MATTSLTEAQGIVNACDAWLLENLGTHEGVFSYSVNGRTVTLRSFDEVTKLRDYYQRVIRGLSRLRRTYARFDV
jgi:hypothetical protein